MMEAVFEAMADRSRSANGKNNVSLVDLGYKHAGVDDGWQLCNSGPGGKGFHNATGFPQLDKGKFPDIKAMTQKARDLGVDPGWYGYVISDRAHELAKSMDGVSFGW